MAASEGYRFIPLPDAVHREPRPQARFDRRVEGTARLILELTYQATQPVHIGAGRWRLNEQNAVRMAARSGDRPVIPGSSMKGLLRARYEGITNSCCVGRAPKSRRLSSTLPSRTYPEYQVVFDERTRGHAVFSNCDPKSDEQLCAACALFGIMSRRGRVAVHDFLAPSSTRLQIERLPERFSPRPHHLGNFEVDESQQQLTVTKLHGRKFYRGNLPRPERGSGQESVEVIPSGTQLVGKIVCTNITAAELGGLFSALGFEPKSSLRIGAGKGYSFGRLDPVGVPRVTPALRPHDRADDLPDRLFDEIRAAFENSPDRYQRGEEWLVWISGAPT